MLLAFLPTELKLNIVKHLDPESTFHFALTSKDHSGLCKDLLRNHARLFAQYSIIPPPKAGTFVWDFAKEVLQDPRKGWYVRELNLVADRPDTHENISEDNETLYRDAADELLALYPYEPTFFATESDADNARGLDNEMDEMIGNRFEDPIIVILIHHLPQLRTFRMTDNLRSDCLKMFMRRVAAGYQNPALAPQMPLQHLKTVAIAHNDTEFSCSVDWAVYFLCVPTLRTFAAFQMGSEGVGGYDDDEDSEDSGNSEAHLRNTAGAPVSNVEELLFHNCQFDPQSLNLILSMIKNLKRFDYQAGGHIVAYQDYEPRRIIKALATHAGHSLEELELAECGIGFEESENDIPFASARDFKQLKALHCETRWLLRLPNDDLGSDEELAQGFYTVEESGGEITDPRDNLPESLEYLYLDGVYEDQEWDQLIELFGTTNACTPKLTLDNTCITRSTSTWNGRRDRVKHGRAVEPYVRFDNPLHANLWSGHNSFL